MTLPSLDVLSVKIPVSDLAVSRSWYAQVLGLREEMEWPDGDGVVRGVGFSGLGAVMLALREHPAAATATRGFGFVNVRVPREEDLDDCAAHLDALGIRHTPVISAARGRLVGFHDLDGHELSFYAETHHGGVRTDAVRAVRVAGQAPSASAASAASETAEGILMTTLAPRLGRLRLDSAPKAPRGLVVGRVRGPLRVVVVAVTVLACLLAGAILTVRAIAGIDTHGRLPHPVPLPAPTGRSIAGS